jgi:hypothetical protein
MRLARICATLSLLQEALDDNLQSGDCSINDIVKFHENHWLTVTFILPPIIAEDTYSLDMDMNIW